MNDDAVLRIVALNVADWRNAVRLDFLRQLSYIADVRTTTTTITRGEP